MANNDGILRGGPHLIHQCVWRKLITAYHSQFLIQPKVELFPRDQFFPSGLKEDSLVRLEIASTFLPKRCVAVWQISAKVPKTNNMLLAEIWQKAKQLLNMV